MWWLRWVPYVIAHPQNPFFTHHLNYPYGVNLLWNTSQELPSLIVAPATVLLGVIAAYNLQMTFALAGSGLCAFLLIRRWCQGVAAPLLGSLIYEFSPYMLGQSLGHADLVVALTPPLFVLLFDDLIHHPERSARWIGVGLGLLATAQLLTNEEVLFSEAVGLLVLAASTLVLGPPLIGRRLRRIASAGATGLSTFATTAAFPLIEQFAGAQRITGPIQNADGFSTDLVNLIAPTSVQWIAPASAVRRTAHFAGGLTLEVDGYLGLPLILLVLYVVIRYRRELLVRVAAATAGLIMVLSLGPVLLVNGHSTGLGLPWALVHRLPVFEDVLPARMMLYVFLGAAVLLAVFFDRVLRSPGWLARGAATLASVVAIVPLIPQTDFPSSQAPVPRVFKHWDDAHIPEGADVLLAPFIRDGGSADPMLWQAEAGLRFKMPQGYFYIPRPNGEPLYGSLPTTLSDVMEAVQERAAVIKLAGPVRRSVMSDLHTLRVRAVMVGPMSNRVLMVRTFALLFDRPPIEFDGVSMWRLTR